MPTTVSAARQCLAGEAVAAVNDAIAIARRRRHSQTTSLHVVSALLSLPSSSSSLLRDALSRCRTAFNSSALELCFSAALDRLPSSNLATDEPPISNSLMAAIKRSQATQRRHPDTFHLYQQQLQQQNSSSAVKVELQQLILSILDDPVVSRVFGEGGFRSHDIKFAILRPPPSVLQFPRGGRSPPLFLCNFSLGSDDFDLSSRSFAFPFSSQPLKCDAAEENCRRIAQVLARKTGRNPLLVGVGASDAACDFKTAILTQNWSSFPPEARGLEFFSIEEDLIEFVSGRRDRPSLESRFIDLENRFILSFGDLRGLVDLVAEKEDGDCVTRLGYFVKELARLLESRRERIWLMGSAATYEIYMKFLSFQPPVDKDWDLQLLPITSVKTSSLGPTPRSISYTETSILLEGSSDPKVSVCKKNALTTEKARDDRTASNDASRLSTDLMLGTRDSADSRCRGVLETEDMKGFYRSMVDKVPWQGDAAWAISRAVTRCKAEARRAHIWLGLLGSDPVGKRKLAAALAKSLFGSGEKMIYVDLSSEDGSTHSNTICGSQVVNGFELTQRGKTAIDFLAGEIRGSPGVVVFLENVDCADLLVQGSLLQAIRTGRLSDSHGREVNVGNTVFIATTGSVNGESEFEFSEEEILAAPPRVLKILVDESERINQKRRGRAAGESKRSKRPLTGLLDLNLPVEEEEGESSPCDDKDAWMEEFLQEVDESVVFKAFDFDSIAGEVVQEIDRSCPCMVEIEPAAMMQILAAAWVAESKAALTWWVQRVLAESLARALNSRQVPLESCVLRLVAGEEAAASDDHAPDILLPARIPFA